MIHKKSIISILKDKKSPSTRWGTMHVNWSYSIAHEKSITNISMTILKKIEVDHLVGGPCE
jgi:hypothetical protein